MTYPIGSIPVTFPTPPVVAPPIIIVNPAGGSPTLQWPELAGGPPSPVTPTPGPHTGGITSADGTQTIEFGVTDSLGVHWMWYGIDGWDSPPAVGTVTQRAGADGGFAGPQYWGPRPLTLRVGVNAPTRALRDFARMLLQGLVPISDLAELRYDEPRPKVAYVRRSGTVSETYPNLVSVDFSIGLVAPDHRKYGASQYVLYAGAYSVAGGGITPPLTPPLNLPAVIPGGQVLVVNSGNLDSPPTVTVYGPIAFPTISKVDSGEAVSFDVTLVAGDTLVVDFDARVARINGTSFRPAIPTSSWWTLKPGASAVRLAGNIDGQGSMTITWRDAYI